MTINIWVYVIVIIFKKIAIDISEMKEWFLIKNGQKLAPVSIAVKSETVV